MTSSHHLFSSHLALLNSTQLYLTAGGALPTGASWAELEPIWAPKRGQKGGQKGPKRRQKRDQNDTKILIDFGIDFGPNLEPKLIRY